MGTNEKYGIEIALEKVLKEFAKLVHDFRKFFFVIPKRKMDKIIFIMETFAWLLLGASLVLRVGRW